MILIVITVCQTVQAHNNLAEIRVLFDTQQDTTSVNVQARVAALIEGGCLEITLCKLQGKASSWCLKYVPSCAGREVTMDMEAITDFQRQLGFCSKLPGERNQKAALFGKMLLLLQQCVYKWIALEAAGHPKYQQTVHREALQDPAEQIVQVQEMIGALGNDLEVFQEELEQARDEFPFLLLLENYDLLLLRNLIDESVDDATRQATMARIRPSEGGTDTAVHLEIFIHLVSGYSARRHGTLVACIAAGQRAFRDAAQRETSFAFYRLGAFFNAMFEDVAENRDDASRQTIYSIPPTERGSSHVLKLSLAASLSCSSSVPQDAQTLFCSRATSMLQLDVFFRRAQKFLRKSFVLAGVDRLNPRCRDHVSTWQLTLSTTPHGDVMYVFQDHTMEKTRLLEEFDGQLVEDLDADAMQQAPPPRSISVVCGAAASGKTHHVRSRLNRLLDEETVSISINDHVDLHYILSTLSAFKQDGDVHVFFNISVHAPFLDVNQLFFQLFICGVVRDHEKGVIFTLAENHNWKFYIEVYGCFEAPWLYTLVVYPSMPHFLFKGGIHRHTYSHIAAGGTLS